MENSYFEDPASDNRTRATDGNLRASFSGSPSRRVSVDGSRRSNFARNPGHRELIARLRGRIQGFSRRHDNVRTVSIDRPHEWFSCPPVLSLACSSIDIIAYASTVTIISTKLSIMPAANLIAPLPTRGTCPLGWKFGAYRGRATNLVNNGDVPLSELLRRSSDNEQDTAMVVSVCYPLRVPPSAHVHDFLTKHRPRSCDCMEE